MNGFVVKYCSACGRSFECGSARADFDCWCLAFPLVFEPTDTVDCWCPSCLEKACEEKLDTDETDCQGKARMKTDF